MRTLYIGLICGMLFSCSPSENNSHNQALKYWLNQNSEQIENLLTHRDRLVKNTLVLILQDEIIELKLNHQNIRDVVKGQINPLSLAPFWTELKRIEQKILDERVSPGDAFSIGHQGEFDESLLDLIEYEADVIELIRYETWSRFLSTIDDNFMMFSIPGSSNAVADSSLFYAGAFHPFPRSSHLAKMKGRLVHQGDGLVGYMVDNEDVRRGDIQINVQLYNLNEGGGVNDGFVLRPEFNVVRKTGGKP